MELPGTYVTALTAMNRQVNSARPDAPVVPHREPSRRIHTLRRALSGRLRRAAALIEPAGYGPPCYGP